MAAAPAAIATHGDTAAVLGASVSDHSPPPPPPHSAPRARTHTGDHALGRALFDTGMPHDHDALRLRAGHVHTRVNRRVATLGEAFEWPIFSTLKTVDDCRDKFLPDAGSRHAALDHMYKDCRHTNASWVCLRRQALFVCTALCYCAVPYCRVRLLSMFSPWSSSSTLYVCGLLSVQ